MSVLIDTHVLLWWLESDTDLPEAAHVALTGSEGTPIVSASVIWEISIKRELGKLRAPANLLHTLSHLRVPMLSISPAHAEVAGGLPLHHRDPFDRMLIAQSKLEDIPIVTADSAFAKYDIDTIWDRQS